MKVITLENIAEISAGQGAPQGEDSYCDNGVPFIKAGNLEDLIISNDEYKSCKLVNKDIANNYKLKLYPKGTLVFAKSGMSATKGRIYCLSNDSYVVNHLSTLIPKINFVNPSYLKYYFYVYPPSRLIKDESYPSIGLADIKTIKISLPPLEDQNHIVEILDQADALRKKRKQAIGLLDDYLKSVFLEMFGDPVKNPKGWERLPLAEILLKIESGHSPVCLDKKAMSGEWGVLKLGAITKCIYYSSENKALPDIEKPNPNIEIKVGDILFSRKNTYDLVAACAYVWETPPKLMMSDLIFRLVPRNKDSINAIFLQALLSFPSKRKMIQTLAGGAAGSMPNISKAKLLEHRIDIPPHHLQNEFAERVGKTISLKQKMLTQSEELENQFQALMQKAFKDEL